MTQIIQLKLRSHLTSVNTGKHWEEKSLTVLQLKFRKWKPSIYKVQLLLEVFGSCSGEKVYFFGYKSRRRENERLTRLLVARKVRTSWTGTSLKRREFWTPRQFFHFIGWKQSRGGPIGGNSWHLSSVKNLRGLVVINGFHFIIFQNNNTKTKQEIKTP